jgi:hypothetical protein
VVDRNQAFTPEHLTGICRALERVRSQRRVPPYGAEAERLALRAFDLFKAGYVRVEALARALRQDA